MVVCCALSAMHATIAHLMHEIAHCNRSQNCVFDSCFTVLARDTQEDQASVDVRRVDEAMNTKHPQEKNMHCPAVV
jgi:hypothetical protein